MIVDANILLYAVDEASPFHRRARDWIESALNGPSRIGFAWQSIEAFIRIATHPRALEEPLAAEDAWLFVEEWLDAPAAWIPLPTRGHREVLGRLVKELDLRSNLIPDASLAALCIEYGVAVVSADSDFARFAEVDWINPVAPGH